MVVEYLGGTSFDDVCELVLQKNVRGKFQEIVEVKETKREVFCKRVSITRAEYTAHKGTSDDVSQEMFRPLVCVEMPMEEYEGEKAFIYDGKQYNIYRVYEKLGGTLELYGEERVSDIGNN